MKLSTRIALAVGITVPLLVLGAGWLLVQLVAADLHTQQDAHLRERAAMVARNARGLLRAVATDRAPAVERARERGLYNSALDVGIRLLGPDGTASGGPQPDASVPLPDDAPEPITVRDGDTSWRALSVRITGRRNGVDGTLWLFSPDTTSDEQLGVVRTRVLTVAGVTAPLAGLLAGAVATRATRPLRHLQQRTSGLDPRSTSTRLEHAPTGIAEVDDLARTLQTVLARYDEQAARTAEGLATARSFSAAASHELRTPLMSMRTNLDILADHPDIAVDDRAEVLDDLRKEHERLLGLLMMLRELGRGDLVETDTFGPVDLTEIAEASIAALRRRHPETSFALDCEPVPALHGWEPGLRTIVDNLLVNAVLHGRDEARPAQVAVALRAGAERDGRCAAVLTVDDQGPGIPDAARESVFERFHRGPCSPGSGLGLTLVAQQVALHRGRIRVLDGPDGTGTRFEVRLPVRDAGSGGGPDGQGGPGDGGDGGVGVGPPPPRRDWMIETAAHPRSLERPADSRRPQGFHKERS
ncbi:sensor histidine kinase [Streptomyces marianii]|uniref:histidine kinase n=1 Tax=Streptomyces marianii TaxID=1817406 RepID=A0A5R9EFA8_9ACTN|nr:HAMP domain-containing sensor histidine kinase [Streptomyces marianii]TLQ47825.1 HAMP domain-containing histidine kinase [Streptomyces marianii]